MGLGVSGIALDGFGELVPPFSSVRWSFVPCVLPLSNVSDHALSLPPLHRMVSVLLPPDMQLASYLVLVNKLIVVIISGYLTIGKTTDPITVGPSLSQVYLPFCATCSTLPHFPTVVFWASLQVLSNSGFHHFLHI